MDKLDFTITLGTLAASLLGTSLPGDVEGRMLCFTAVGAVCGGFVGASMPQDPTKGEADRRRSFSHRWATNLCTGCFVGPLLAQWVSAKYPDFSPSYIALASGGLTGLAGVTLICILLPKLTDWIKIKSSRLP